VKTLRIYLKRLGNTLFCLGFCQRNEGAKTYLIDLPVMILFGLLFSILEERDYRDSIFKSAYFWHGVVLSTIFNAAVVYAAIYYPDWMWMYYVSESLSLEAYVYLFFFLYYLPYVLGFALGVEALRASRALWGFWALLMVAAEVWLVLTLWDRYSVVGTAEQFASGTAVSLFDPNNPLSLVMNISMLVMGAYYAFLLFRRRKKRIWKSSINY
jgi:hypothetical protein